ncbi:hypothetical protein O4220_15155 [Rhodococcus ruber]|uniref:Uncharacterized protein n=1 Tax=Rhodococcus ruber TaxID=1830 RepID=A0ABT4MFT7_9NOCA|nr:hypothetical protein [Rhodococcus ruber]MCZ4519853.1 hypothetical protein [Rhodococcus ruber]
MAVLALLLSGLLAGLLSQSDGVDFFGDTGVGGVLFSSGGGGVAIAVILASALAMLVRGRSILTGLSIAAAVVAGVTALLMPSDLAEVVAGGVLLGCTAVRAIGVRVRQALLIGSFLVGLLSSGAVEALQHPAVPRRYADYLSESDIGTPVVVPVLCLLAVLAVAWAARVDDSEGSSPPELGIRTIGAMLLVSIGGLLLAELFARSVFQSEYGLVGNWYFGILVVPVLFGAAALLPGRGGIMVLAGTAVFITSTTTAGVGIEVSDGVWTLGLVAVTALAVSVGVALGLRSGRPFVGFAILAMVCVTALFEYPPLDNVHYVASLLIFPAGAAYLYVACTSATPASPVPVTLGLAVPVAITVPMVVTYGWTAYTPLTSVMHSATWPSTQLWFSTGAAVVTVVLAGVGTRFLGRRPLLN